MWKNDIITINLTLNQKIASKLEPNLLNAFFACLICFLPERTFVDQVGEFSEEVGRFSEEVGQFSEEVGHFLEEVGTVLNRSDLSNIERVCKNCTDKLSSTPRLS